MCYHDSYVTSHQCHAVSDSANVNGLTLTGAYMTVIILRNASIGMYLSLQILFVYFLVACGDVMNMPVVSISCMHCWNARVSVLRTMSSIASYSISINFHC